MRMIILGVLLGLPLASHAQEGDLDVTGPGRAGHLWPITITQRGRPCRIVIDGRQAARRGAVLSIAGCNNGLSVRDLDLAGR